MYSKDQNAFLSTLGNGVTDLPFRVMINNLAKNNPYANAIFKRDMSLETALGAAAMEGNLTRNVIKAMYGLKDLVSKSVPGLKGLFDNENNFGTAIVNTGKTSINDQYTAGIMPTVSQTLNVAVTINNFIDIVFCIIPKFDAFKENSIDVVGVDDIFFVVKTKLMNGMVQEYHVLPEQSTKNVTTQAEIALPDPITEAVKNAFTKPTKEETAMPTESATVHDTLTRAFAAGHLQSTDFKRSVYSALNAWKDSYDTLSTGLVENFVNNTQGFENMTVSVLESEPETYCGNTVYRFSYDLGNSASFIIDVVVLSQEFLVNAVNVYIKLKNDHQINHFAWQGDVITITNHPYEVTHGFLHTVAKAELAMSDVVLDGGVDTAVGDTDDPEDEPHGNIVGRHMSVIDMLEKLEAITSVTALGETTTKLDKDDMFAKLAVALTKWGYAASTEQIYSVKSFIDNWYAFGNMDAVIDSIDKKGFTVHFKYSTRDEHYFNIAVVFEFEKENHTVKSVEVFETHETNGKVEVVGFALDESDFKVRIKESQAVIRCYRFYFKKIAEPTSQQNKESKAIAELATAAKERAEKQAVEAYASGVDSLIRGILGKGAPEELITKVNQVVLSQYTSEVKKQVERPQRIAGIGDSPFLVTRVYEGGPSIAFGNTDFNFGVFKQPVEEANKTTWDAWEKIFAGMGLTQLKK